MARIAILTVLIHLALNGFIIKAVSTALNASAKAALYNYYIVLKNGFETNYSIITGWF